METLEGLQSQLAVLRVRMRQEKGDASRTTAGQAVGDVKARASNRARKGAEAGLSAAERAPNPSLPTLHDDNPMLVLELDIDAHTVGKWRMTAKELGFPITEIKLATLRHRLNMSASRSSEGPQTIVGVLPDGAPAARIHGKLFSLRLPQRIATGIRDALALHAPHHRVLWFQIVDPAGYLPLVGWETVLRRTTTLPVLRLPYHPLDAEAGGDSYTETPLDVLLLCTAPYRASMPDVRAVRNLIRNTLDAVPLDRRCTVHVFADVVMRRALANVDHDHDPWSTNPDARGAVLYELPPTAGHDGSARGFGAAARAALSEDNPWGNWICDRLDDRAMDVFHLIAPGALFAHDAAAVVARTPGSDSLIGSGALSLVRFASSIDLHGLVTRVGAWSTVLSSYGSSVSRIALRVVADQLARARPGSVALHDLDRDSKGTGTHSLYRFLQASLPAEIPTDHSITLYTHPSRVGVVASTSGAEPAFAQAFRDVAEATAATRAAPLDGGQGALPNWLSGAQRYLEQQASCSLQERPRTSADRAAQQGVVTALAFLSDVVAKAANETARKTATHAAQRVAPLEQT
ncbi:MAG TPA: hypothetical protein VE869_01225 [Gemmatimonas sp.]|nr:hypothetical protein [Gemmatimonas sp.]